MNSDPVSGPWVSLYPAGVSATIELEHADMLSIFRHCVSLAGDDVAMAYFDGTQTYAELDRDSDALSCWLVDKGVGSGDRVSIIAQNIPGFATALVAAWKVGAIPVPANPMYRASELARILGDAEPAALICQEGELAEVREALELCGLSHAPILALSPADGQTVNDARALPEPVAVSEEYGFSSALRPYIGQRPASLAVDPDAIGLILYTSGTTGQPKGTMIAHRSLAFNAQFMRDGVSLRPDSRILAIAPFFHITGLVLHLCTAFRARCGVIANYRFEPNVVREMIRNWRPTFTVGAITAFNALARLPGIEPSEMASLEQVFSGGAPVPPALKQDIEKVLGFAVHPCYGMTETAAPAVFTPFGVEGPTCDGVLSIGVPIPGTCVRIADENGNAVPAGEVGEVLMQGPQIMLGYWRKEAETAEALRDGWLHSGDVGLMDEQGWIYLVDRKKDMIIASGFKVWPREVEDVLYAHPAIREAAVIGVPDDYRGENVKAFVSFRPGETASEADLIRYCREQLAAYKVPRIVEVMDDLPKTVSGKIQRAALRPAV